jgi:RND superfamily putative drug exporter
VERFAEVVLRHRGAVVLLWLVLLVAGAAAAGRLSDRLSFDFSLPGQPGYQSEQQLVATYGVSSADTLVPVITVPAGQTVQDLHFRLRRRPQDVRVGAGCGAHRFRAGH